jgi:transposase
MRKIKWDNEADQIVFDDYLRTIELTEERKAALTAKLEELSKQQRWAEPVGVLRCFRGFDTVSAMSLFAELHDFSRFPSPRGTMSFVGLVPSENSTGDNQRRGCITKAGNTHARRILIEAAWHYRHTPRVGRPLQKRREGQPADAIAIADRAMSRLHRKYWHLTLAKNKPSNVANVAVARELVGFIWAALYPLAVEGART